MNKLSRSQKPTRMILRSDSLKCNINEIRLANNCSLSASSEPVGETSPLVILATRDSHKSPKSRIADSRISNDEFSKNGRIRIDKEMWNDSTRWIGNVCRVRDNPLILSRGILMRHSLKTTYYE